MATATGSLPEKILDYLDRNEKVDTLVLAKEFNEDHQKLVGAVKSLQAVDDIISVEPRSTKSWELTKEGAEIVENGSHEALVWKAVPAEGIPQPKLLELVTNPAGCSKAISNGWVSVKKINGIPMVHRKIESITDEVQQQLKQVLDSPSGELPERQRKELKKRKLLQEVVVKSFILSKGANFSTGIAKPETDLTSDMMASGAWKTLTFKPYNFAALGIQPDSGHFHPLLKVREEFRQIFLEMGFSEMPTNNYVESSFWNFDALFQPQQHPARDAHDTFFISDPAVAKISPPEYVDKVKRVHSHGGFGSQGYGYDWKESEAQKNLLRTHTTAVSARMLYKLANQPGGFKPAKYFSIDRVFRNETLDSTHLAEFHQVEGVIADYNLSLGNLIAVLHEFFKKLGLSQLKFKPAYNPYTEPSMEIFCFHFGLNKWVEIGNSGVFRPEMLLPMGLPRNVSVIAWGLSLERPTMIKYGLNNIRDLVGPKVDLQMVYDNPICIIDDKKQPNHSNKEILEIVSCTTPIMKKADSGNSLACLIKECEDAMPKDTLETTSTIMIKVIVDPEHWPHSLIYFGILLDVLVVHVKTRCVHQHIPKVDAAIKKFSEYLPNIGHKYYTMLVLWAPIGIDPILMHPNSGTKIFGEVNLARYFGYLLGEELDLLHQSCVDSWLDEMHEMVLHGNKKSDKQKLINKAITLMNLQNDYLAGAQKPTIADICLYSHVARLQNADVTIPWVLPIYQQLLKKEMVHFREEGEERKWEIFCRYFPNGTSL